MPIARIYGMFPQACPHCGTDPQIIALVTHPEDT
jgi:hypothetical protein